MTFYRKTSEPVREKIDLNAEGLSRDDDSFEAATDIVGGSQRGGRRIKDRDVLNALVSLAAEGVSQPSYAQIRAKIGYGSYATLSKILKGMRASKPKPDSFSTPFERTQTGSYLLAKKDEEIERLKSYARVLESDVVKLQEVAALASKTMLSSKVVEAIECAQRVEGFFSERVHQLEKMLQSQARELASTTELLEIERAKCEMLKSQLSRYASKD